MRQWKRLLVLLPLLLITAAFQVIEPVGPPLNPNAAITWPLPVYAVSGQVEIEGSANLPGQTSYFIEFRALNPDLTPLAAAEPWIPATLPSSSPVINGVLGLWDTTIAPDGLYEVRMRISVTGGSETIVRVSPLRIDNANLLPVETPEVGATISAPTGGAPTVTSDTNANVRLGDSVNYPTVGALGRGQSAQILAISSTGSGWYLIQLPDGRRGWISPTVVAVSGDTSGLPRIAPPPVPFTPTPPPPTAAPLPDALIVGVRFDREIIQGQPFQVIVTVRNESSQAIGPVAVACNFTPQNQLFSAPLDGLGPFAQIDIAITAQLDSGGGANTTANCAVDLNNVAAELNEANNYFNLTGFLRAP